jgi:hypothetical protein
MYVRMKPCRLVREGMNHAVFLDIGPTSDPDETDIPSQDSSRADVTPGFHDHIPDQYGLGVDKGVGICMGSFSFKFIKRHDDFSQRQVPGDVFDHARPLQNGTFFKGLQAAVTYDVSKKMSRGGDRILSE